LMDYMDMMDGSEKKHGGVKSPRRKGYT